MPKQLCIGAPGAHWLGLEGALRDDTIPPGSDNAYGAVAVTLHRGATSDTDTILSAALPHRIDIPGELLRIDTDDGNTLRLIAPAELATETLKALRAEVVRRLEMQEIHWAQQESKYLGLPCGFQAGADNFRGDARIWLDATEDGTVLAEFSVRGTLRMRVATGVGAIDATRSVALVVVLRVAGLPRLRLDLDDFNFGFPEIDFANLDLSNAVTLPLDLSGHGVSRVFERIAGAVNKAVEVTVTSPSNPVLVLNPSANGLGWRLAESGADDAPLVRFGATIKIGGADFATISDLSAEGANGTGKITGSVVVGAGEHFTVPQGTAQFGPLVATWSDIEVTPRASAALNDLNNVTLRAGIVVDRLAVYAAEDPTAVLAVHAELEITPSGVCINTIKLLEPYPIELVAMAGKELTRAAAGVLRLFAQIGPVGVPPDFVDGLRKIADVLARLATALARAAVFAGDVVGDAASLIGNALIGMAEAVGKLIRGFGELLADAAQSAGRYLAFEIRIATDPFQLRQVLVTLRRPAGGDQSASVNLTALGFELEIKSDWEPGLLVDLGPAPGVYLIATRHAAGGGGEFASLSTDLWLQQGTAPTRPLRDASNTSGERDKTPLLKVTGTVAQPREFVLLLAGIRDGRGVFFQQVTNVSRTPVADIGQINLVTAEGRFQLEPLKSDSVTVKIDFQKDRVLALLGMGESGKNDDPSFLETLRAGLSQTVWIKPPLSPGVTLDGSTASADLVLGIRAAGVETEVTLTLSIDLQTLNASFKATNKVFALQSRRIEERALGLLWVVEQRDPTARAQNAPVAMFRLKLDGEETGFELDETQARMEVRFTELSSEGRGVVFEVEDFTISRAGLDLTAAVTRDPVRLNGVDVPFQFTTGKLMIRSGRLTGATIGGRGSLPRQLVGEVDCSVLLDFRQDSGSGAIVLQSAKVEFGKKGEPVVCHSTRFTLTINDLDIAFVKDGGYHFYFLVTGALQFTPRAGEFESGLLQYLKDVRIDLERTPLTADPRVLLRHISFQKALNPKKTFSLFNLFEFELRGFGFHPASPKFDGDPAMNISGQIKFAQIGDVMQPRIDFHGLWIAPPKGNGSLPRVKADGLGVDIGLSGVARIRGTVLAVDPQTPSLEAGEIAPPGYNAYGFLGEGQVSIEGWATMSASMGFLEVARKERPDERKKSFFLYLEANKLAVEIPVVIWTFYLREVGFGFGYRYTLRGIKDAEAAKSTAQLVKLLDDVSKRQGDLAHFGAWMPDPEGDKVTLAMRAAFQSFPATRPYDEQSEKTAAEPFFFDIVAALRSDMTFLMNVRGWVATNYWDFLNDTDGTIRNHPGFRGYLFISAPRSELLSRNIGDSTGYVGDRLGNIDVLKQALKSVDWSSTLYIGPGLFHWELGWPNELMVRLKDEPNFRVVVRGGMIFRASGDGLLWGYNVEADAFIRFAGGIGGGAIGVAVEASLSVKFVARIIAFISWRLKGSLFYGLISLDANLVFRVRAWLEVDLGFTSFTIRISFSFSIQFSAAVELAISTEGVGARVSARIGISVFGCTLSVGIGFTVGSSQLDAARARVQRFLALGITNEATPDPARYVAAQRGDEQIKKGAGQADEAAKAPVPADSPSGSGAHPPINRAKLGRDIRATNFWLVLHVGGDGADQVYALLVPKEPQRVMQGRDKEVSLGGFYASPQAEFLNDPPGLRVEGVSHTLFVAAGLDLSTCERWIPDQGQMRWSSFAPASPDVLAIDIPARWNQKIETDSPQAQFTLGHLFDECFLYDANWIESDKPYRKTTDWKEPTSRRHGRAEDVSETDEAARRCLRDNVQRERAASAARDPVVASVYEARSTVLSMFLDQFVALAGTGKRLDLTSAHVTDLGLVFRGPRSAFDDLAQRSAHNQPTLMVSKLKADELGCVEIFNSPSTWFVLQDPVLERTKDPKPDVDGVKLDWRLAVPFPFPASSDDLTYQPQADPEQYLHHYEIVAELNDTPRWESPKRIKPAATLGHTDDSGDTKLLRPDWQFVDDLSDLSDDIRRAILAPQGEEGALGAALAWVRQFPGAEHVVLTYSVTPVDIAGTKGTERSFVVQVDRPQPPIRPADAELRFFVGPPGDWDQHLGKRPTNLGIVLALRDPAAGGEGTTDDGFTISRSYRLIVDPEDIVPSGNYGSDALTDRLKGPRSGSGTKSGDEVPFEFSRDAFASARYRKEAIGAIEPDEEAQKVFDSWLRLAGRVMTENPSNPNYPSGFLLAEKRAANQEPPFNDQQRLFDVLWARDVTAENPVPARVATRYYLQTLLEIRRPNETKKMTFESRRVPVAIEVIIDSLTPSPRGADVRDTGPVMFRPEAFEWPVRLDVPPLGDGQVRATSGFALFRAPTREGRLESLLGTDGVVQLRDPERRMLTTVEWDAMPDWATDPLSSTAVPAMLHRATVGGFDVHELDLDELAPLDTAHDAKSGQETDSPPGFASATAPWRRARRVARVQLLPASAAMLVPHSNDDLLGWQAHYPSETWRAQRDDGAVEPGGNKPLMRSWWSAREATPRFPDRVARRRLLPLADEDAIAELMRGGTPQRVYVRLRLESDSAAAKTLPGSLPDIVLTDIQIDPDPKLGGAPFICKARFAEPTAGEGTWAGWWRVKLVPDTPSTTNGTPPPSPPFSPTDLRALQLCLAWNPAPAIDDQIATVRTALEGVVLTLAGEMDTPQNEQAPSSPTGQIDIPLSFSSPLHPVLEEVIAELALSVREGTPYRRYTPVVQPPPDLRAKDLAGFFSASASAKDPYGWGVLQFLGLSSTIRLYDGDRDAFVEPKDLLRQINAVMVRVVGRYDGMLVQADAANQREVGVPFAEVLLRPGKDRIAGPVDATVDAAPGALALDDSLAVVQLSLRPRVEPKWEYACIGMLWKQDLQETHTVNEQGEEFIDPAAIVFTFNPKATNEPIEILRVADGHLIALTPSDPTLMPGDPPIYLPPLRQPRRHGKDIDPELTLLVRFPGGTKSAEDRKASLKAVIGLTTIQRKRAPQPVDTDHPEGSVRPIVETDLGTRPEEVGLWLGHPSGDPNDPIADGLDCVLLAHPDAGMEDHGESAWVPVNPFERFEAKTAEQWSEALTQPPSPVLAALRGCIRAMLPDLKWDDAHTEFKSVVGPYLDWAQRFLDFGCGPQDSVHFPETPRRVRAALAAPIKATPWRLGAASDDTLAISFLHADRWAHARAYAIKPYGRYQELMIGAGAYDAAQTSDRAAAREVAEALVPPRAYTFALPIGYAVAVSPRTERIEPPLVLGSKRMLDGSWQLVVARHGEESLAFSNRPLFARLGWEGVALAFVRDYREPTWPARLGACIPEPEEDKPQPVLHPTKQPPQQWTQPDSAGPDITATDLGTIVKDFPTLWKGADIYRFRNLPHYYRVTALAVARAGVVVSPMAVAAHEDFAAFMSSARIAGFRDPQQPQQQPLAGGRTAVVLEPDRGRAVLEVTLPVLSHADLLEANARKLWIDEVGDPLNIGWWPDPDVIYALQRKVGTDAVGIVEEDAEVRLVARAPDQDAAAIVVRARGTHFTRSLQAPTVTYTKAERLQFAVHLHLALVPPQSVSAALAGPAKDITQADIDLVNGLVSFRSYAEVVAAAGGVGPQLKLKDIPTLAQLDALKTFAATQSDAIKAVVAMLGQLRDAIVLGTSALPAGLDTAVIEKFNNVARRFGAVLWRHNLTLALQPQVGETVPQIIVRIGALADALIEAAAPSAADPGNVRAVLYTRGWRLKDWTAAPGAPGTPDDALQQAGFPEQLTVWWPRGVAFPLNMTGDSPAKDCEVKPLDADQPYLALSDLPTDDEMATVNQSAIPAGITDAVKRTANNVLTGGAKELTVRAVHGRGGANGAVGVGTATLDWPSWIKVP